MRLVARYLSAVPAAIGKAAFAAASVQELAQRTVRDLALQTELPKEPPPPSSWSGSLPEWSAWLLIALGCTILLYLVKDYIPLLRPRNVGAWGEADEAAGPDGSLLPRHRAVAEALARDGRFVEAMHELLLAALAEIRARLGERLADSLTSREILRKAPLPESGRQALAEIIGRVERTYFGEHPAQGADYILCRDNLDLLSTTLGQAAS